MSDASEKETPGVVQRWIAGLLYKLRYVSGNLLVQLGDKAGGNKVIIYDSSSAEVANIDSLGRVRVRAGVFRNTNFADVTVNDAADSATDRKADTWGNDNQFNILLNGAEWTSIGFHDANSDVGVIAFNDHTFFIRSVFGAGHPIALNVSGTVTAGGLAVGAMQAWQAPALVNGWVNYANNYEDAGYFKDPLGFVHMRGLVRSGTLPGVIFTLPAGCRPAQERIFTTSSGDAFAEIRIRTWGDVYAYVGNNGWISLAVPPFRAEQ